MVDERVEELLNREENRVMLDELEKASQRVEMARKELEIIKTQEIEAAQMKDYVQKLESRTSEVGLSHPFFLFSDFIAVLLL